VGLPIFVVFTLSTPLVVLFSYPLWQDWRELKQRRASLLQLQRNLPALERQLEESSTALAQAKKQQALLISLLAGRDKVQTFLALLNQEALIAGVKIRRYQPLLTPTPSAAKKQSNRSKAKKKKDGKESTPEDPLLGLGYRKTSVAFAASGRYSALQQFLQRIEALELLVESSELEIKAAVKQKSQKGRTPPVEARTQLTLKLSFYDLPPKSKLNSGKSKQNSLS